jgi:hypothetical protein
MTKSIRTMAVASILGGVFGTSLIDFAWSVEIHTSAVQTPKIGTPKIDTAKINTQNGTNKINTQTNTQGGTQGQNGGSSTANGLGRVTSFNKPKTPSYPQGVQIHNDGDRSTVTIDGKTLPLDKETEALMKEAESPPPKMWLGNQLVPIKQGNIEKAKALQSEEGSKALQNQNGTKEFRIP